MEGQYISIHKKIKIGCPLGSQKIMREVHAGGAAGGAGSTSYTSLLDNRESGRLLKLINS